VVSVAIMIAYGVDEEGRRERLAVEPMWEETEESWHDFSLRLNLIFYFLLRNIIILPKLKSYTSFSSSLSSSGRSSSPFRINFGSSSGGWTLSNFVMTPNVFNFSERSLNCL